MNGNMRRRAFTLLEMLVAMALMATLAGVLYASLMTAFRGRDASTRALEPARRTAAALQLLGNSLQSAVPPTGLLAGPFLGEDAEGETGQPADVLLFHALVRDQADWAPPFPIVRIELTLALDQETQQAVLLRRTTRNLLASEEPEPVEEVLCRNVQSLDVAFFDGTVWTESWDSTVAGNALPQAVNVVLKVFRDGGGDGETYSLSRTYRLACASVAAMWEGGTR